MKRNSLGLTTLFVVYLLTIFFPIFEGSDYSQSQIIVNSIKNLGSGERLFYNIATILQSLLLLFLSICYIIYIREEENDMEKMLVIISVITIGFFINNYLINRYYLGINYTPIGFSLIILLAFFAHVIASEIGLHSLKETVLNFLVAVFAVCWFLYPKLSSIFIYIGFFVLVIYSWVSEKKLITDVLLSFVWVTIVFILVYYFTKYIEPSYEKFEKGKMFALHYYQSKSIYIASIFSLIISSIVSYISYRILKNVSKFV